MTPSPRRWGAAAVVLLAGIAAAQEPPAEPNRLPPSLLASLDALGGFDQVPDGVAASLAPFARVRSQPGRSLSLSHLQAGVTAPAFETADDGLFVSASADHLGVRGFALLPDSRVRLPTDFWDVQAGGAYLRQFGGGQAAGVSLSVGSASDRPFSGIRQMSVDALAFYRWEVGPHTAWTVFVVSETNGQVGHNVPIPGVAYEFDRGAWAGMIGFPFVTLKYRPADWWDAEFNYAALTDVLARGRVRVAAEQWLYGAFEWTNRSWLRAERRNELRQTFLYEKRLEGGWEWHPSARLEVRAGVGYAFDRYFAESTGFSLTGRNRVDITPSPYGLLAVRLSF